MTRAAERRAGFVMTLRSRGVRDRRVLAALEQVPREPFLAPDLHEVAYADRVLPLPCGQTLERPSLLASLVEQLAVEPGQRVLEIGTGSGWSAAVLAHLGGVVETLERYRTLEIGARTALEGVGAGERVTVRRADGLAHGGSEAYDRVLVHGAVDAVPQAWRRMLRPGGRAILGLVSGQRCAWLRIARGAHGFEDRTLGPCAALPLESRISYRL